MYLHMHPWIVSLTGLIYYTVHKNGHDHRTVAWFVQHHSVA